MNSIYEKYDRDHLEHILSLNRKIENVYQQLTNQLSGYLSQYQYSDLLPQRKNVWFLNEKLKKLIENYLGSFADHFQTVLTWHISQAWNRSQDKADAIVSEVLKASGVVYGGMVVYDMLNRERPKIQRKVLINPNPGKVNLKGEIFVKLETVMAQSPRRVEALTAFLERTIDGMNLSQRVWNFAVDRNRIMVEELLANGIIKGQGAPKIAQTVRQYLQNPDTFFRRVRNPDTGLLELSTKAKAYHPGQGVYRSSHANARRLALTETNMAYRSSDCERWEAIPMVVGYEVMLSVSHPAVDMCDDLKGSYPKDFFFTGWHSQCFCKAIPILFTQKEMDKHLDTILEGSDEYIKIRSVNTVNEVPKNFEDWIIKNQDRANKAKSLPYFMRDNKEFISKIIEL